MINGNVMWHDLYWILTHFNTSSKAILRSIYLFFHRVSITLTFCFKFCFTWKPNASGHIVILWFALPDFIRVYLDLDTGQKLNTRSYQSCCYLAGSYQSYHSLIIVFIESYHSPLTIWLSFPKFIKLIKQWYSKLDHR